MLATNRRKVLNYVHPHWYFPSAQTLKPHIYIIIIVWINIMHTFFSSASAEPFSLAYRLLFSTIVLIWANIEWLGLDPSWKGHAEKRSERASERESGGQSDSGIMITHSFRLSVARLIEWRCELNSVTCRSPGRQWRVPLWKAKGLIASMALVKCIYMYKRVQSEKRMKTNSTHFKNGMRCRSQPHNYSKLSRAHAHTHGQCDLPINLVISIIFAILISIFLSIFLIGWLICYLTSCVWAIESDFPNQWRKIEHSISR